MTVETDLAECRICGGHKLLSEFSRDRSRRGGIDNRCKTCAAARSKRWHEANPAKSRNSFRVLYERHKLSPPLIWIYEMWSADHRCLYVGKTDNLWNRMRFHKNGKHAGSKAYAERRYIVLRMAEDPEARAILERQPLYNETVGRPRQ